MNTSPYWASVRLPRFPALSKDVDVDVAIVGGGLTGITTAWLLTEAGVKVALIERHRCADSDTGHTTAHLTYVTDYRLHQLAGHIGHESAKAFWKAGAVAIDEIERIARKESISVSIRVLKMTTSSMVVAM